MAIRPTDRRRLARLAGPRIWARREEVERRVALRERFSLCLLVAVLLEIEGVDLGTTCVPARLDEAVAKLDAIDDTPESEQADEAYLARSSWIDDWQPKSRYRPPLRQELTAEGEIEQRMRHYRTDAAIDFARASLFDLYAWCLSRHGASYREAAAECQKAANGSSKRFAALSGHAARRPERGRHRARHFSTGKSMRCAPLPQDRTRCRRHPPANSCCRFPADQQTRFQSPSPRPSPRKRGEGEQRRIPNKVGKRYCRRFSCVPSPRSRGEGRSGREA
jgi:hypothetical protein